jgi:Na+-transporting methylmalonyl-CoA/oxaloacetate decarboxylase gamma subunit
MSMSLLIITITKILVALSILAAVIYFIGKTPDHIK